MKVLGITWNQKDDELSVDLNIIYENSFDLEPTKRNILKFMASIYDPIRIAVFVMKLKVLFQQICLSKCQWDDILLNDLLSQWFLLRETMKIKLTMPSYYFSPHKINEVNNVNLNGFCDASKKGYAAVIYINGHVPNNECQFRN